MQYDLEKVNILIPQIYDAALEDKQWPVVVQRLAQLLEAEVSIPAYCLAHRKAPVIR